MGTGFHDLRVWHEAKTLTVAVYRATDTMHDFSLRDQLRRAAISVPSNIAEGDERDTDKDCGRSWKLPRKSALCLNQQYSLCCSRRFPSRVSSAP